MFPTVLLLIPLYSIMRNLGLLYTPWALVLAYTTFTLPFSVWLLNGFFNDLPLSLEEAALVDGCNRRMAFFKIILPILGPCLVAHRCIYLHDIMERVYICGNVYEQCDKNNTCSTEESDSVSLELTGSVNSRWNYYNHSSMYHVLLCTEEIS